MEHIFTILTKAVEGSALVALLASFVWGILSVVLSPCHLSSIPLVVGFISEQKDLNRRKAFGIASLFALGILITIAAIGVITSMMGKMLGDVGPYGNYFVAALFILVGLHLVGVLPLSFSGPGSIGMQRRGYFAALILGLVFGIALGPCTFAYMAPVIGASIRVSATNLPLGILLMAVYGLGHCSVIVLAGTSTEWVQRYLNWDEKSHSTRILKVVCGVLVICGGIYLFFTA